MKSFQENTNGKKSTMDVHFKLEEVINQIDKLPEFAKEPVLRAYKALKELHGYYLSMPQIGYADQTHAVNANTVREALGEPQRIVIVIKEHDMPVKWCSFDVFPGYGSVVDGMKAIQKTEAGRCRNLKEFLHEMPQVLVLNNGKTFNLLTMEMTRMSEYRYEYKEVIT